MMSDVIIEFDGMTAIKIEDWDRFEVPLQHGDTVWSHVPGLPEVGDWGVVNEEADPGSTTESVRTWGEQYPHPVQRDLIKYVELHACECGNVGPTSWRICHPEA